MFWLFLFWLCHVTLAFDPYNDNINFLYNAKSPNYKISYGILNQTAEDYLKNTKDPKLLLAYGHTQISDVDMKGNPIHEHRGWYTVDLNPSLRPDFVADFTKKDSLKYLSEKFAGKLKVVYAEWPPIDSFWKDDVLKMIYNVLKPGGHVLSHYDTNPIWQDIYTQMLKKVGFKYSDFYQDHIVDRDLRTILQAIPDFKQKENEDINYWDVKEGLKKFNGTLYLPEELSANDAVLEILKRRRKLKRIDPLFEWGMSYNNYVVAVKGHR